RGCPSGAGYSSYLYSPHRIKHPMIRSELLRLYRKKRKTLNPIEAWKAIVESSDSKLYKQKRGAGGFVRVSFDEALEIIAAANIYTIKKYGPDRIFGFSPIPAMSMVSYASGARYLSLIGGAVGSFYDWYCDLPPSSPQVFGEQTDVPESADWYNSTYLVLWGSNVPQTRRPDAHFYTEARYKGTKTVVISPDFSEASKFADVWLAPRPGTDASLALAMGHVIFKEFHIDSTNEYFSNYVKRYSDMPHLVILRNRGDYFITDRFLRASDILENPLESDNWKTVVIDTNTKQPVVINGSIGFRYEDNGKWNLHTKDSLTDTDIDPKLSLIDLASDIVEVGFPDFTNNSIIKRKVPTLKINKNNNEYLVVSVFDLLAAHYGIDRNLNDPNTAKSYDDECAYTPAILMY
ncbi:MAG TPA: nitrate reductase subunit alpha, partial [Desulfurella acetivorans]|nr:nitrate reductase subunit alpha [Desulfurella acetivorans]